jgi:hypothetical protein
MKCRATRDGLLGQTSYVREGEIFEAAKCPSWAEPVNPPKKKTESPEGDADQKDAE